MKCSLLDLMKAHRFYIGDDISKVIGECDAAVGGGTSVLMDLNRPLVFDPTYPSLLRPVAPTSLTLVLSL